MALSQHVDEETGGVEPGPLVPLACRHWPLAAADLSAAGSRPLSDLDEDRQEGRVPGRGLASLPGGPCGKALRFETLGKKRPDSHTGPPGPPSPQTFPQKTALGTEIPEHRWAAS